MPTLSTNGFRNNTRVYYAMLGTVIGDMGATTLANSWKTSDGATPPATGRLLVMHGLQQVGVGTNFNLEQIFELGQLSLYVNSEDVPDIEITTERVLDGYTLTYHAATQSSANATLAARSETRTDFRMAIGRITETYIDSGNVAAAELYCSGAYVSSVGLNLVTDGVFSESVSFVGNNKKWIANSGDTQSVLLTSSATINFLSSVFGSDTPNTPTADVLRRKNFVTGSTGKTYGGTVYRTVMPNFITNVEASSNAVNARAATNAGTFTTDSTGGAHLQSFTTQVSLNREAINQLGTFAPYNRYASFPVEVTSTIEVIAIAGDNVTALETSSSNLSNHEIQVVLDDSTVIMLGKKNKLSSVNWGGADATGGNATITYSFSNFNDFIVLHSGDPVLGTVGASGYWKDYFV